MQAGIINRGLGRRLFMLKRIVITAVLVSLMAPCTGAGKEKTADINDDMAVDSKYGWSIQLQDNWKVKNHNEPNVERLFMEKKNYLVNPYVERYGGDYTVPRIMIFAQEFEGTARDFEALLKKSLVEHRSDNEIISRMELLRDGEFITSGEVVIDSLPALQMYAKRNYQRVLAIPESGSGLGSVREEYVNDHEVHEIYLFKKDNIIYVIQAYCEREYYNANAEEFQKLVRSFRIPGESSATSQE
jgi:hypothetical protein